MEGRSDRDLDILLEPLYVTQHLQIGNFPESLAERVKSRGRERGQGPNAIPKPIFCEMLTLVDDNERYCWKEVARWIKYEEKLEHVANRWSKPHVPLVTTTGLFQLKNCLRRGSLLLNVSVATFEELAGTIIDKWEEERAVNMTETSFIFRTLLRNKEHVGRTTGTSLSCLLWRPAASQTSADSHAHPAHRQNHRGEQDEDFVQKYNEQLKKYLDNAETSIILIAQIPVLNKTLSAFVRLTEPRNFAYLSEIPCPVRYLFVLLTSLDHHADDLFMIGRCMGALMTDTNFRRIAAYAMDAAELSYGIDEFQRDSIVIPPGKWHLSNEMEPADEGPEIEEERKKAPVISSKIMIDLEGLQYTGRLFGGLVEDIRRRWPSYISDFKDAFTSWRAFSQCFSASVFLFFANLTNLIAFGSIMGSMLDEKIAVTECIVSAVISGILMGLFAGQPLCIMSATGPLLIFETLFYEFCYERDWNFFPTRFWLCFWAAIIQVILVATDASFLVVYITRFTEELFATLVGIVFVVESFEAVFALSRHAPLTKNFRLLLEDHCICNITRNGTSLLYQNYTGQGSF